MSEPPPILEYATPERRVPVYLVVILYLWVVGDVLGGMFPSFIGFVLVARNWNFEGDGRVLRQFGYFLLIPGLGLMLWGSLMFWLIGQMTRNRVVALRRMTILMIVKEIVAWAFTCLLVVWGVSRDELNGGQLLSLLFFVGIAVAASVTRILLRRAVKRVSTAW